MEFELTEESLAFFNHKMEWGAEPGGFHIWIGSSSEPELWGYFKLVGAP